MQGGGMGGEGGMQPSLSLFPPQRAASSCRTWDFRPKFAWGGWFKHGLPVVIQVVNIQHPFVRRSLTKGVDLLFYLNFASFKAKQVFVRSENLLSLYNEII
nr:hypothetical protein [Morchella crassipes]